MKQSPRVLDLVLGLVLALALPFLTPDQADAATITADGTTCTLADAITAANDDMATNGCPAGDAGADTIVLDADVTLTAVDPGSSEYLTVAAGLPDVTDDLTITAGLGSVIRRDPSFTCEAATADPVFRFLQVISGLLTLEGLSFENGCFVSSFFAASGGGIYAASSPTLTGVTLDGVSVVDHRAIATTGSIRGGFLYIGLGTLTVTGGSFEGVVVEANLSIDGGAIATEGEPASITGTTFRDFDLTAGGSVNGGAILNAQPITLEGLEMESFTIDAGLSLNGGFLDARFSGSELTLLGSSFRDLFATAGGTIQGGAIRSGTDQVVLSDVLLSNVDLSTSSICQGGGFFFLYDALVERMIVEDVICLGSTVEGAGAFLVGDGGYIIQDSVFRRNEGLFESGDSAGGALYAVNGIDVLERSAFVDNRIAPATANATGDAQGGALALGAAGHRIRNVTFAGNSAEAGSGVDGGTDGYSALGGAIYAYDAFTTSLSASTVSGNQAIAGPGADGFADGQALGGGLFVADGHTVEIAGSILSGNTITDADDVSADEDCRVDLGTLTSLGYNLAQTPDASCDFSEFGDVTGMDPLLYPVDDYGCAMALPDGGCVPTAAVDQTSWAVDWSSCAVAAVTVDARDLARWSDIVGVGNLVDACDVGAFEARDSDEDGITDVADLCPDVADPDQADGDADSVGDACDACLGDDATGDADSDLVCDDTDACAGFDDGVDADGDSVPDGCDQCAGDDASGDSDADGVCDDFDLCFGDDATGDADSDGLCAQFDCDDADPTNACAPIFDDGFESGDVDAWSSSVP